MVGDKIASYLTGRNALVVLITTVGLLPLLICNGGYFTVEDVSLQMIPFVYETKRVLSSGLPLWSWNTYFGDNFFADYAYYTLFNPFSWFNSLFPYRYIPLGFTITLYLKLLVCAYIAQRYFIKMGYDRQLSLIGSLLYTFSSWSITSLMFAMFLEPMMLFPLLLIMVERMLRGDRYPCVGLAVTVFVMVLVNYYFAVCSLMAGAIYFLFRLYSNCRHLRARTVLKAALSVALGILMASFVLVPVMLQLSGSPRMVSGANVFDLPNMTNRVLGLLFPKFHEGPFAYLFVEPGCSNNAAGIALFGLLPFALLAWRRRNWVFWLTAILIVLYVTPLTGIFSLFTSPFYTRWAYALSLSLILCTLYWLQCYGLPSPRSAIWYAAIFFALYLLIAVPAVAWYTMYKGIGDIHNIRAVLHGLLIALNLGALVYLCARGGDGWQRRCIVLVTVCVVAQFALFSLYFMGGSPISNPMYLSERDYYIDGVEYRHDEPFGHRHDFFVDEAGIHFSNFGMISGQAPVQTYHSMQNNRLQSLFRTCTDKTVSVFSPNKHRVSFDALMSVKDVIHVTKTGRMGLMPVDAVTHIGSEGMFDRYAFDYFIPMGFAYDRYIPYDEVARILAQGNDRDIPLNMLNALCIRAEDEEALSPYLSRTAFTDTLSIDVVVSERRRVTCDTVIGDSHGLSAHISLDRPRVLFFSIVADPGFTTTVDGVPTKVYEANLGLSAIVVPAGSHDIRFEYFTPGLKAGGTISLIAMLCLVAVFLVERRRPKPDL